MKIGELAAKAGVSARSIRHYEAMGLLKPLRRSNGYRDYHPDDLAAAMHIRWLISAGLSAKTIGDILPCVVQKEPKTVLCERTRNILRRELGRVEAQMGALRKSQRLLKRAMGPALGATAEVPHRSDT